MPGTFISKQHFTDLDACMAWMASIETTLINFNRETASSGLFLQLFQTPFAAITEGKTQAQAWTVKSNPGMFSAIDKQLDSIANFATHLVTHLDPFPFVDRAQLLLALKGFPLPPGPAPHGVTPSMTNCLQLLSYHQRSLALLSETVQASSPGYEAIREGIYKSLPRVIDYMSVRLQPYNPLAKVFAPSTVATQRKRNTYQHYTLGIASSANFHAQYRRITVLLGQASWHFGQLLNSQTPSIFSLNVQLLMIEVRHVQRFCREIVALRTGR